ncbi:MAG: phage tail protein [Symploca sp. SIO1A3]|nr:phage tail protein [Symploca sp. SIO2C1]NER52762.1 phage tail protein [Symploca sp. SIO1A3]
MSEAFIGEIRMFAGNFNPVGWAFCNGAQMIISQNQALFSLLGTTYGGDGRTTFNLPDLRGRVPIHMGQGPGLTNRPIGSKGGAEQVTLTSSNLPKHTHAWQASEATVSQTTPEGNLLGKNVAVDIYNDQTSNQVNMSTSVIATDGGHASPTARENLMPYLAIYFIIALQGIYPSRH